MARMFDRKDLIDLPCDCCGAHDEKLLLIKRGVVTNHPFRIVKCRSCAFVYVNPRLTEQKIISLYDQHYYAGCGFDSNVDYFGDYMKTDDAAKMFRPGAMASWLRLYKSPPATILDYGCGLGDLMRQAAKLGYNVSGFEVSPVARAFCTANGFSTFGDPSQIPSGQYDIVTAIEVVEHAFSPTRMFGTVFDALKPGGLFLYTTGNVRVFDFTRALGLARDWDYITPEGHINFFSPRTIRQFFRQAGFSGLARPFIRPNSSAKRIARYLFNTMLGFYLPAAVK